MLLRRIQQLEEWIGAPLIEQHSVAVTLTREGEAFLPIAQEICGWIDEADGRLAPEPADRNFAAGIGAALLAASRLGTSGGVDGIVAANDDEPSAAPETELPVLLIDDSVVSLTILSKLVSGEGHNALTCSSAQEALATIDETPVALVVTDYRMPGMDGAAFARQVRKVEAQQGRKHLPIIAVSAKSDLDTISLCFESGMDDYLCKPVGITEMKVVLDRWLPVGKTLEAFERTALDVSGKEHQTELDPLQALCSGIRGRVEAVATAIEDGEHDGLVDELASIRDEAYMAGAFSFGRTCVLLRQCIHDEISRDILEKRGAFLSEFVRLERALAEANKEARL